MEFLKTGTQYGHLGYPLILFYFVALCGFVLITFRPYWAFLFSLFFLAMSNLYAAAITKMPFFGYHLNLYDLLVWILGFAMLFELLRKKRRIWAPKILLAIFVLVIIGGFQSLFEYGFDKQVLRRIWAAAIFPILFLVAANMVNNERRSYYFYWTLFFGAVIAALQHIYFIRGVITFLGLFQAGIEIRTIAYIWSGGLFLVMASIFAEPDKSLGRFKLIFYNLGLGLVGLSYILSFTRGIYIAVISILIVFPFIINKRVKVFKVAYSLILLSIVSMLIVRAFLPDSGIINILNKRFKSFIYKDAFSQAYETRSIGAQTEFGLWLHNSSLVLGIGCCLPSEYEFSDIEETGALNHVGFMSYLVHFGLVGVVIYGLLLPIATIKISKRYYVKHSVDYGGRIGLIAIVCALMDLASLPWSYHHLLGRTHVAGLIYGSIWGLYCALKKQRKNYEI